MLLIENQLGCKLSNVPGTMFHFFFLNHFNPGARKTHTYSMNCCSFASLFKLSNWLIVHTSIFIVDHDRVVLLSACVDLLATSSVSHCLLQ